MQQLNNYHKLKALLSCFDLHNNIIYYSEAVLAASHCTLQQQN
jgi:hypothetical protein